jgi:hypothetical protein
VRVVSDSTGRSSEVKYVRRVRRATKHAWRNTEGPWDRPLIVMGLVIYVFLFPVLLCFPSYREED